MSKRIIAVVGATGKQGGGLVHAIQNDTGGEFIARAIARDPNSDAARALKTIGAQVVKADASDAASVSRAFEGAYGAYCVTFFDPRLPPEKETADAATMAQAAKNAGVQHVIWSTLDDTRKCIPLTDDRMPTLFGKYKCPHFDAKADANGLFTALGLPVTFLLTSFYWDNFIDFGMGPKKGPDGKLALTLPIGAAKMPGIATEDIGACALGIFKKETEYIGKTVGIAGEHLTGSQMAAAFAKVLDQDVAYQAISPDVYRGFGFPGAEELGNMFQFFRDCEEGYCAARGLEVSRALNPALKIFDTWLEANKHRIVLD